MASLNFNKSMLGGRITHDLEMKTTQGGSITLAFSIAVQRKMDKNDECEIVEFLYLTP
jgi:single-stranded DNA-binding protein